MFKLFSFFIMLFSFKQDSFIKAFFREPNKDIYTINNELLIEKDLNWSSIKEDSKNLKQDYKNVRNDLNKSFEEYKILKNG